MATSCMWTAASWPTSANSRNAACPQSPPEEFAARRQQKSSIVFPAAYMRGKTLSVKRSPDCRPKAGRRGAQRSGTFSNTAQRRSPPTGGLLLCRKPEFSIPHTRFPSFRSFLPGRLHILPGRQAVFSPKGPVKPGIIAETAVPGNDAGGLPLRQHLPGD